MDLNHLKNYAIQLIGTKYVFGGDDPVGGFDCSGFVSELLRASGVVPWNYRNTAQGIYNLFDKNGSYNKYGVGSLAFYGKDANHITHIGFCIDSETMIEAGGGDSTTDNDSTAIEKNAFVRVRPIKYRKDFLFVIRPPYPGLI